MTDNYADEIVESQRRIEATLELLRERYPSHVVEEALQNVAEDAAIAVDDSLVGTYDEATELGQF